MNVIDPPATINSSAVIRQASIWRTVSGRGCGSHDDSQRGEIQRFDVENEKMRLMQRAEPSSQTAALPFHRPNEVVPVLLNRTTS